MPTASQNFIISDEEFEQIYRENYDEFLHYAENMLQSFGAYYVSTSGRAEEAVQEMAAYAWEHRDKMAESESPVGWMYRTLYFKIREFLREDRVWRKRMLLISEQYRDQDSYDFRLKTELQDLIPLKDYLLLKHLYLDGYTYSEVSAAIGLKKSALAMRVNRAKAQIREDLSEGENLSKNFGKKCEQSPPSGHYIVEEAHRDGT